MSDGDSERTLVQKILRRLQENRPIAFLIVIAIVVTGLATVIMSIRDIVGLFSDQPTNGASRTSEISADSSVQDITIQLYITSPAPNQSVKVYEFVRGQAPSGTKQVWLIVRPLETTVCWVQGFGKVNADGSWRIIGQFGEERIQDAKKSYEVRAVIANPHLSANVPLEAGRVSCELDVLLYSKAVDVVRI